MSDYEIRPAGDTALVIDFGNRIEIDLSKKVLALAKRLDALQLEGVIEAVPTIRSLSIYYEPLILPAATLQARIKEILADLREVTVDGRAWDIPVCYDPDVAPDLAEVAAKCNLSTRQVIELHSCTTYHVYMLGFLPGLAYLGDLSHRLALPRRTTPRPRIPAGSLGMGGKITCIFPMATPCGLHIIGQSPAPLWSQDQGGAVLSAGDKVRFMPISLREYDRMQAEGVSLLPTTSPNLRDAA